jgi:hypothetical protein
MDKGIRPFVNAKFIELNVRRKAGELTNTVFRKTVMADAMEQFGITLASAATHYNHALQLVKAATPAEVEGLGRPDDKKGGRKKKEVAAPVAAKLPSIIPVPTSTVLQNFLRAIPTPTPPAAVEEETAPEADAVEEETAQAVEAPAADPNDAGETAPEQTVFRVLKKKDGSVVAEGLTLEAAKELVGAAAKAKKAALYWV